MNTFQICEGFYLDIYTASFEKPVSIDGLTEPVSSLALHCIERNIVDGEKAVDMYLMEFGIKDAEIKHVKSLENQVLNALENPERVIGFDEWARPSRN
ncbi:hypothetical protein [Vibrio sp. Evd11]|uniref:hypothetical protein n=1 Tax=Vibrio sp. Evd11 TaxID=1207404 RepID=UPI000EFD25EB|nr:hypothetical protein [Vibrio sp. Evd11]